MKIETNQNNLPKSGQFVAVWEYDGKIWAETIKRVGGRVVIYDSRKDEWVEPIGPYSEVLTIIKPS